MIKKVISMVVIFSLVLCSCCDKNPGRRDNGASSLDNTPKKTSKKTRCCLNEITPWGVMEGEGQCTNPEAGICYNIVSGDSSDSEKIFPCCIDGLNIGRCVEATTSTQCYSNLFEHGVAAVKKAFSGKYFEYAYDAKIQTLAREVLAKKILVSKAFEEAKKRVAEIPKAVEIIGEDDFTKEVFSSNEPKLVYFFATWCHYCKNFAPIANKLAFDYDGKVKIYKVDIDKNEALFHNVKDKGVPTLFLYENGKLEEITSDRNYQNLKKIIDDALSRQKTV